MCTQMGLIWFPVHRRPHTAGSPERLGNDSDSGSQECELCDVQPGSSACMLSIQATTARLGRRGHLALKEGILPHLCSWNNIRSVCWRERETRGTQREIRPNQQPCFWLSVSRTAHTLHSHLCTNRHLPGLPHSGKGLQWKRMEIHLPRCY